MAEHFILEKQQINFALYTLSFLLFCTFAWLLLEKLLGIPLHLLIKRFELFVSCNDFSTSNRIKYINIM